VNVRFWHKSDILSNECPLLGVKRTSRGLVAMSAGISGLRDDNNGRGFTVQLNAFSVRGLRNTL
jgi:hypothetical protein